MTKKGALFLAVPFCLITLFFLTAYFFTPKSGFDDIEGRSLAAFPKADTLKDGSFPSKFETYLTDQFPFRRTMVRTYTELLMLQNKFYGRNLFISDSGWLIPRDYSLDTNDILWAAGELNALADAFPDTPVYFLCTPQKTYTFGYMLPYGELTHHEYLELFLQNVEVPVVNAAQVFEEMPPAEKEARFFKSDYHWNARGAFTAFSLLMERLSADGLTPAFAPADFHEEIYPDKLLAGDLNRRLGYKMDRNEPVMLMRYKEQLPVSYELLEGGVWTSVPEKRIFAPGLDDREVSYNDIYTANYGGFRIESPHALTDQKILVLKDSMQNPTTNLFPVYFCETMFVDLRYRGDTTAEQIIQEENPDIVVIVYNCANIRGEMYENMR